MNALGILSFLIALAFCCLLNSGGLVAAQEECICVQEVRSVRGLRSPCVVVNANDGSGRLFVGEQLGLVYILDRYGIMQPDPYVNISYLVWVAEEDSNYEMGFLSMVFHPQFATNRKLYVYYNYMTEVDGLHCRLSELQQSAEDPNTVDLSTIRTVMSFFVPSTEHNGGTLLFDDEGYLFLFTGDGGFGGDPNDFAQNLTSLLGKGLRIDINVGTGEGEYGIPPTNPFVGDPNIREEIYVYGLRNPWRVDMDIGDPDTGIGRGRMFIGDVGQGTWEEVDLLTTAQAGRNYGWAAYEAETCYKPPLCEALNPDDLEWPIHFYQHNAAGGYCVIGGSVYRGRANPNLAGLYFFADWEVGKLFYLQEDGAGGWIPHQFGGCTSGFNNCTTTCQSCPAGSTNVYGHQYINTFGLDESQELYFASCTSKNPRDPNGALYRIVSGNQR